MFYMDFETNLIVLLFALVIIIPVTIYETQFKKLTPIGKFVLKKMYVLEGGSVSFTVQNALDFLDAKDVNVIVTANLRAKNTYEYIHQIAPEEELEKLYGSVPFYFGLAAIQNAIATENVLDAYGSEVKAFKKRLLKKIDNEIFFSGYKVTSVEFNFIGESKFSLLQKKEKFSA